MSAKLQQIRNRLLGAPETPDDYRDGEPWNAALKNVPPEVEPRRGLLDDRDWWRRQ
jgi:hypothetical protein